MSNDLTPLIEAAAAAVAQAKALGADAAEAVVIRAHGVSVDVRHQAIEHVERAETGSLAVRAFVGNRHASVSVSAVDEAKTAAERAVRIAREAPEDLYAGLASAEQIAGAACGDLDLDDPLGEPDMMVLEARAWAAEGAALAVAGVENSEGASASYGRRFYAHVTSNGFVGAYARTSHGVSCTAVAGAGTAMERDYDYTAAVHVGDLDAAEAIGHEAGQRAVRRLNATRPAAGKTAVVFDRRAAGELLGMLVDAADGDALARGSSFLRDRLGDALFPASVRVLDDPTRVRGLASAPFDAEGFVARPLALIEAGVFAAPLLDLVSARKLEMTPNGRARRSGRGTPHPGTSNVYCAPGDLSREALLRAVGNGILITETIGDGLNPVTGDYSVGASGFAIVNGEVAEPVSQFTIASNVLQMFAAFRVADDLRFRGSICCPTVFVGEMSIAGA